MDATQPAALSHTRGRGKVIPRKGCGRTGVLVSVRFRHTRLKGTASVQCNASERLAAYRAKCPRDKMGRGSTYKSHKEIQVCRLSLCCQSRDTRGTPCKRNAWWTQLADVYGRRRIRAKYHKTKTPKRHCERISHREREERHYLLSVLLARSDKRMKRKLYFVWMWYVLDMYHILFLYELCSMWNYLLCCIWVASPTLARATNE